VVLVHPNKENLKKTIRDHGKNPASIEGCEAALKIIESELNEYRTSGRHGDMFPQRWLPPAIGILAEGFTEENRMMNSTMKMVRPKIMEVYGELLDFLYLPEAKIIDNKKNMDAIAKILS
jgi:long-chain acyl-CoA synthetase